MGHTANGKSLWRVQIAPQNSNEVIASLKVRGDDYSHAKMRAERLYSGKNRIMPIMLLD